MSRFFITGNFLVTLKKGQLFSIFLKKPIFGKMLLFKNVACGEFRTFWWLSIIKPKWLS